MRLHLGIGAGADSYYECLLKVSPQLLKRASQGRVMGPEG